MSDIGIISEARGQKHPNLFSNLKQIPGFLMNYPFLVVSPSCEWIEAMAIG